MRQNLVKDLSRAIKAKIAAAGGDWKAHIYDEVVSHQGWKSPPLVHNGSIFGFDFKDLINIPINLSFDEYFEAYEDFLRLASSGKQNHTGRWATMFGVSKHQASMLFPKVDIHNRYNHLPAIASLAVSNFGGCVAVADYQRYVVVVEDCHFGIQNGEPMANYSGDLVTEKFTKGTPPSLIFGRRREVPDTKLAARLSTIFKATLSLNLSAQERREMKEAMIVLIFLDGEELRQEWLVSDKSLYSFPEAVLEALSIAKSFRDYLDPLGFLRDQLIPNAISSRQFNEIFGNKRKMTQARFYELDLRLMQLTDNIKNGVMQ